MPDVAVVSVVVSLVVVVSVVVPEASSSLPPQPASASAEHRETDHEADARACHSDPPSSLDTTIRARRVSVRSKVSRPMDVLEIAPGLWRWTAFHEEWNEDVGCVYVETEDGVVLIDPLVPLRRHREVLEGARPRRQAREGAGSRLHHGVLARAQRRRDARALRRPHLGAVRRARRRSHDAPESSPTRSRPDDPLPGGLEAHRTARAAEVVYWIPEHSALVPGDVLIADGKGGARMCPESWLPASKTHRDLAASLRPLLDLPVRRVLVSHGRPVLTGGGRALARALEL